MSVTSRDTAQAERSAVRRPRPDRLHQPWRAVVALVELVLAGLAVWLAFGLWSDGITVIRMPDGQGGVVELTHYHGDAMGGAIGLGLLAALLVLDAVRQLILALRTRSRRSAEPEPWPSFDEDA